MLNYDNRLSPVETTSEIIHILYDKLYYNREQSLNYITSASNRHHGDTMEYFTSFRRLCCADFYLYKMI